MLCKLPSPEPRMGMEGGGGHPLGILIPSIPPSFRAAALLTFSLSSYTTATDQVRKYLYVTMPSMSLLAVQIK